MADVSRAHRSTSGSEIVNNPSSKLFLEAIVADRPSSCDPTAVFDDVIAKVEARRNIHASGSAAINRLLRLICVHFDHSDGTAAFQRLNIFTQPTGLSSLIIFCLLEW